MKEEYDFSDARRGPVIPTARNKTRITIRLDSEILDWFRRKVHQAGGGNYQTLINDALRKHIDSEEHSATSVEAALKAIRMELGDLRQTLEESPRRAVIRKKIRNNDLERNPPGNQKRVVKDRKSV